MTSVFRVIAAFPSASYAYIHFSPSFFMFGKSKNGPCTVCGIVNLVLMVIGVLTTIAALIGVYKAHYPLMNEGMVFGSTAGSLSLAALVLNLFLVKKLMAMCPCSCNVK